MGILNITPDSFYDLSRAMTADEVEKRVVTLIDEGADIIDVGGYSSRPGADDVDEAEELRRLERGIEVVKRLAPSLPISVDTFRANVAREAVSNLGADIINDISGGELDEGMLGTVIDTCAPYIMMHMRGTPANMQQHTDYTDIATDVIRWLAERLAQFSLAGADDVIIDPGFGFSKTVEQNLEMLDRLNEFKVLGRPILIGVSRKSMIYRTLDCTPADSLYGTTALNTMAIERGASILRVHDVKAARDVVDLTSACRGLGANAADYRT